MQHALAVWKPNGNAPELAGELIYAIRENGETFVQFSKNPLPIVTARASTNSWHIDYPEAGKTFSGAGVPPKRLVWFNSPMSKLHSTMFTMTESDESHWKLENKHTGETLKTLAIP